MTVSAPRVRVGAELRRIREGLGLSGTEVGAALGWSQSKVSRIETGRFGSTVWELAELTDFYGVAEEVRAEILTVAAEGSGLSGAWIVRAGGSGRRRAEVVTIDSRAGRIRQYQTSAVPGLLQSPDYTRALTVAGGFGDPDEAVRHRLERQAAALHVDEGPEYSAVLEEAALLRSAGAAGVLDGQVRHLLELSDLSKVDLRLLTADSTMQTVPMNSFVMYDFLARESPTVVLVETQTADLYLSADADVSKYSETFERLRSAALAPEATAARLRRLLRRQHADDGSP